MVDHIKAGLAASAGLDVLNNQLDALLGDDLKELDDPDSDLDEDDILNAAGSADVLSDTLGVVLELTKQVRSSSCFIIMYGTDIDSRSNHRPKLVHFLVRCVRRLMLLQSVFSSLFGHNAGL
jgi:hypothetical protein